MDKIQPFDLKKIVEKIKSISESKISHGKLFVIALSGGRSIVEVLVKLATENIDFSKWYFLLVDERNVSVNSSDSNTKQIQEIFSEVKTFNY